MADTCIVFISIDRITIYGQCFFRSWLRVASFGYGEYNHFGIRNFHIDCGRGIRNRIEDERRTGLDYLTEYWEKENDYSKP